MKRPVCQDKRKDGAPCRAPALPDSALCWVHDPRQAEAGQQARAAGAAKGGKVRALNGQRRKIDTHAGLAVFLSGVIHDVAEGKMDTDTGRAVMYGCSVMRHLAEHELERRMADVERKLATATATARRA